ncbi:hypothetical protein TNCV_774171 [Trichonephila clavipes]|nr:hypothetical protein TNCV_774171 [Trichonephila clavipes]
MFCAFVSIGHGFYPPKTRLFRCFNRRNWEFLVSSGSRNSLAIDELGGFLARVETVFILPNNAKSVNHALTIQTVIFPRGSPMRSMQCPSSGNGSRTGRVPNLWQTYFIRVTGSDSEATKDLQCRRASEY